MTCTARLITLFHVGEVDGAELTENEWSRAWNLGDRHWLYVVYDCGMPTPRLIRAQNPFYKLVATAKGGVIIDEAEVLLYAAP